MAEADADVSSGAPTTVLHVLGVLDRGGVERRTLELLQALEGEPVRFVMCTLTGRTGELAADYRRAGAVVVPMALRSPLFPARFLRLIRREGVDAVHSHVLFASGYILALAAFAGVRVRIAHFNSDAPDHEVTGWRRPRYAVLKKLIDRTATHVVGVSPSTLDANWGPQWPADRRFAVLPSGIDLTTFSHAVGRPLRAELGIADGTSLILHLGRADIPTKNRELAVSVLGEARRRGQDLELVFVGRDGKNPAEARRNREQLTALARAEGVDGHLRFLGERSDVPEVLASSDALLFTSRREGLPGVLLEAVAAGTPVVSSDVPGAVYIADQVDGVTIVGLSQTVATWTDALLEATDRRAGPVPAGAEALRGTVFDLESCVRRSRELWRTG